MNKITKTIKEANPRLKGLMIMMVVYMMVMVTTITSGATNQIDNYQETVAIHYQDGDSETKDYLVRQDTVKNVLEELDVKLNEKDTVNKELEYIIQSDDLLQVNRIREAEIEEIQTIQSQTVNTAGLHLFATEVVQQGQDGEVVNKLKVTYENNRVAKKELLSSTVTKEKTDTIIATGTVQPGAYFTGKLTTYGGDCKGGNGTSSCGISLSPTSGVQGSHSAKLYYKGNYYYCLAADPSIPFGTIIKITNHNYSIESTAYGIVVDRGGAIKKNHIDIFNGTEAGKYFRGSTTKNVRFEIVSVGSGKNFWK